MPSRPFEFGILELTVLALFVVGIVSQRSKSPRRRQIRWACQVVALVVVGFWKHSPISLAKIASMSAGYLPDPSSELAIYLLVAGFLLTSILYGRNIYCLYVCPFNAAQRFVGLIGGASVKLPSWLVRAAEVTRNVLVFAALFLAFLTLKPALASYEPFAALFSLTGTTLQWLLLFLVLTMALVISTPFCNLFCPVRTVEKAIQDLRNIGRRPRSSGSSG
jgi:polyferredoxin